MLDEKQNLKIKTLLGSVFVQGNKILDDSFPCWDLTLPKKKVFTLTFWGDEMTIRKISFEITPVLKNLNVSSIWIPYPKSWKDNFFLIQATNFIKN